MSRIRDIRRAIHEKRWSHIRDTAGVIKKRLSRIRDSRYIITIKQSPVSYYSEVFIII